MGKEIERLKAEIEQMLQEAEQLDAEQDAALGSRRGDELPAELKQRETMGSPSFARRKLRLEAEAAARADEEQRRRDQAQAQREADGRKRRGKPPAPIDPSPEEKAQMNFTDPEAKIMKQSNKGFDYSYNAQAVVDGTKPPDHRRPGRDLVTNDKEQAVPMAQAALNNLEAAWDPAADGERQGPRRRFRTRRTRAISAQKRWRDWSSSAWTRMWLLSVRSTTWLR